MPEQNTSLVARDITMTYGARRVLDGNDISVTPGQRVGLVGENGTGKSTFLRILAGVEEPDRGTVERPEDLAYLPQVPEFPPDATVGSVLDDALAEHHAAVAEIERLGTDMAEHPEDESLAERMGEVLQWAEVHDAWDAERRATVAAHDLGLDLDRSRLVSEMSGGQQVRLALAAMIARRPECVMLDEPTNHLDDAAMAILEEFLAGLPGVVLVASHDRTFLDNCCTQLIDLDRTPLGIDGEGGNTFSGTFSEYLRAKRQARKHWEETWQRQQDQIADLRDGLHNTARNVAHNRGPTDNDKFITKFKGAKVEKAVSRRVNAVEAKLDDAMAGQVLKPRPLLRFTPPAVSVGSAGIEVQVRELVVDGRLTMNHLEVQTGEKVLVSGPNGCGKSTLLAVLAGVLQPTSGAVHVRAHGRDLGYLPQDVTFADPSREVRHWFAEATGLDVDDVPGVLSDLGLVSPRDLSREVGVLSVGQQRRLALAELVADAPRLQLLDEPTNHISLALATELEEALLASAGTVLIASHDRWLRRRWTGREVALPGA